jgi:SAM-dependent methyltransferase
MGITERILAKPSAYRAWQTPFAREKFVPILRHNDMGRVRRALDVGCGPGTNTRYFDGVGYLGIDLNERYVEYARRHTHREFIAVDATKFSVPSGERFDFILLNSFLHHIADEPALRLLTHLSSVLADDGHIHVLELVLPQERSLARMLADRDRGAHPRPLEHWRELLEKSGFETVVFEPYSLGLSRPAELNMWNMVYFKGRSSSSTAAPGTR